MSNYSHDDRNQPEARLASHHDEDTSSPEERQAKWRRRSLELADNILDAYRRWDGYPRHSEALARLHPAIVPRSPTSARVLVERAEFAAPDPKDSGQALALIEAACALDPAGILGALYGIKCDLQVRQGQRSALIAQRLYDLGCRLGSNGAPHDALFAYKGAAQLDAGFLWPDNNYAWLLATDSKAPSGLVPMAIYCSLRVCHWSGWSYWPFLGTLAACYAASGDFERAVDWQRVVLRLAPADHRADEETALQSFEAGLMLRDPGFTVAAGEREPRDAASPLQIAEWRGALNGLLTLPEVAVR